MKIVINDNTNQRNNKSRIIGGNRAEEMNQSAAKNRDTKVNNEKTHARIKKPLLLMKISANTCTTQRQIAI